MKIKTTLIFLLGIILIFGTLLLPPGGAADDWPTYQHDPGRTGFSTVNAPDTGNMLWNFSTGGYEPINSPVVADGMAFFGGGDGKLYAVDADTGEYLYNISTDAYWGPGTVPAVVGGVVYFGDGEGNFHAFHADNGTEIWNFTVSGSIYSSPTAANNAVYFGTSAGRFFALRASDGSELWNRSYQTGIYPASALGNGMVFFSRNYGFTGQNYEIVALNATTGEDVWNFTDSGSISSSPAFFNNTVFSGTDSGIFRALNASTGEEKWNFSANGTIASAPAIGYGSVIFGSEDTYLYCLNIETGALLWKNNLTTHGGYTSPAIADGKVYAGTGDGRLLCVDAYTGEMLWNYSTQYQQYTPTAPAIGSNKMLYTGMGNTLYCLGTENIAPFINFSAIEKEEEEYIIHWRAGDADGDRIGVRVYYGQTQSTENATLLKDYASPAPATGTVVWNTSSIPAGRYYIIGEVSDGFAENLSFRSVNIAPPPAPENRNYTLRILSPADGKKVSGNATVRLIADANLSLVVVYIDGEGIESTEIYRGGSRGGEIVFSFDSTDYRNGDYTLTVKGYSYQVNESAALEERKAVNETSITLRVENEYVPVEALAAASVTGAGAGAGISALVGRRAGRFRLRGVKSATKKKRQIHDSPVIAALSVIVALISLITAYAYAQVVSPKTLLDFLKGGTDVRDAVMSAPGSLPDLVPSIMEVIPYIAIAIGAVIGVRLVVDRLSTERYGMESTYRLQLPGLISLGLTTALFATPFGYPGKSVHEIPEGREKEFRAREGRVASARVFGTLSLLLPFYLLRNDSFLLYEVGEMLVLMTAFFLSLPLRDYEGRHLYRWNKGAWAVVFLLNTGLFYGWQLLLIPEESLLIGGAVGLAGVALVLKGKKEARMPEARKGTNDRGD